MLKDYFNGTEWIEVGEDWLEGIDNVKNITEIYQSGSDKIKVIYNNDEEVYYQDVHGNWGFPTVIK